VKLRKTIFVVCLVVSTLCLSAGYWFAGRWIGAAIAISLSLVWLLARKYSVSSLPYICLFASVTLAVAGQLIGAPSLLMICGSGFALAVWDLILLDGALGTNSLGEQSRRYENSHLQSLALALGGGLLVAFLGGLINLQIPFLAMLLFVALVIFGIDRALHTIKKQRAR
jgi:hypothetical protein